MEKTQNKTQTNPSTKEPEQDLNSTLTKLRTSSSGIKFLLNIRNLKSEDFENDEFVKENKKLILQEEENFNQISDEDYKKNLDEMDNLIKDILKTKNELKMQKIKESVKTREDMLNFFEVKDCKNFNYAPEPIQSDLNYLKKIANTKSKEFQRKDLDFKNIKSILNQQNNFIHDLDLIEENLKEENVFTIKQSFFPTTVSQNDDFYKIKNNKKDKNKFGEKIKYDFNYNYDKNNSNKNDKNSVNINNNNSSADNSVSTMNATGFTVVSAESSKNYKFKNPLMNKNSYNLTEEEMQFMNKHVYNDYDSDDLLDEIDSCIKIGEEIDDYINYVEG